MNDEEAIAPDGRDRDGSLEPDRTAARSSGGPIEPIEPQPSDAVSRLLRLAAPRPVVPVERALRVETALRAAWRERVRARRRRSLAAFAAAAALLVAVGAAFWWRSTASRPVSPQLVGEIERITGDVQLAEDESTRPAVEGEPVRSGALLVTSEEGRAALRLLETVSLRLDRSTRVRLLGPDAIELVAGALYVDSPAGARDLRIDTRFGEVREIGTQFEVRAVGDSLRVRVREGAIELRPGREVYQAGSGVELALAADGRITRRSISRHDGAWDWAASIAPPFELDGRTLGEFLAWVVRETGREIRFADPQLAASAPSIVLRGAVVDLSPAQALLVVLPTCGLEHRVENGAYVLARARS